MKEATQEAQALENTEENLDSKIPTTIPYDKFQKTIQKKNEAENENKLLQEQLKAFKEAELKRQEDKLLEEKNYQELLSNKELKLKELEQEKLNLIKSSKLEKIRNNVIIEANKLNANDSEDILAFINIEELETLDSQELQSVIKDKISKLKESKLYLFSKISGRNESENGLPNSVKNTSRDLKSRDLSIEEAFGPRK